MRRAEAAALRAESDGGEGKHGGQKHPSLNKEGWGGCLSRALARMSGVPEVHVEDVARTDVLLDGK